LDSAGPDKLGPQAPTLADPTEGYLLYWTRDPALPPASPADELRWHEVTYPQPLLPRLVRDFLAMGLLGVFLLSLLSAGLRWLSILWPEQVMLAACLGLWAGGLSLWAAALILLALLARCWMFTNWARRQVRRWWHSKPKEDPSSIFFQS
jgi:hypothetical protein